MDLQKKRDYFFFLVMLNITTHSLRSGKISMVRIWENYYFFFSSTETDLLCSSAFSFLFIYGTLTFFFFFLNGVTWVQWKVIYITGLWYILYTYILSEKELSKDHIRTFADFRGYFFCRNLNKLSIKYCIRKWRKFDACGEEICNVTAPVTFSSIIWKNLSFLVLLSP